MTFIEPYLVTVTIVGLTAVLLFVQLLVADVVGLKSKHTPGHPVTADHGEFLFRTVRALANSNESIAIFILAVLFCVSLSASPEWVNRGAATYFAGRIGHMAFYYANIQLLRSLSFVVSLIGLVVILVAGFRALL